MGEAKEVFVVVGVCGEYSDKRDWPVAAYFDRTLADRHADAAHDVARELQAERERRLDAGDYEFYEPKSPLDASIQFSYTGTDYYVMTVPVLAEVPAAQTTETKR